MTFRNIFSSALAALLLGALFAPSVWAVDEPVPQTLITNVQIFDGINDKLMPGNVLIEGNLIQEVGDSISAPDATVIDGGGRTLMPGLIDSHVHLTHTFAEGGVKGWEAMTWEEIGGYAIASAKEHLMNGFTTVRDMGGMGTGFKRAIDKGYVEGPRIYSAGAYITQTGGHADLRLRSQPNPLVSGIQYSNLERLNLIRIADGVPAMLTAVRENFAEGAAYIKIHAGGGISSEKDPLHVVQYTPEEFEAAGRAVKNWDTYFTVHAYNTPSIEQALDGGALCIDHGQMMSKATMKRIVGDGIFLSSNLTGISPDIFKHPVYGDKTSPVRQKVEQFQASSQSFVDLVKKHRPKRVFNSDIVFSTKTYFRQHMDYEKHISGEWFGNHEALIGLTSMPGQLAQLTGQNNPYPGKLGVIEEGAYADILLVDGNPLDDLAAIGANKGWFDAEPRSQNVESIKLIMKDGKIYKNTL
jgi:imidazolonepropionase-like amidohydrolase